MEARGIIDGPVLVSWDCRPGDVINIPDMDGKPRNARVVNTYPEGIDYAYTAGEGRYSRSYGASEYSARYTDLISIRAEYVAMIVPVRPRRL